MRARLLLFAAVAMMAVSLTAAAAGSSSSPSIGRPVATPAQPKAGSAFSVTFHVTHATSVAFTVTLGGKAQHHTNSFRGGNARTTMVLPASAAGKSLAVKLTAHAGTATATRRATFVVRAATPPSLLIGDASVAEGNSGTTPLSFRVTLTHATTKVVSVKYATSDGTATAPSDYAATSGTLTFNPGETDKTIAVSVVGDTVLEPDESLAVTLSGPVNATTENDIATGTITNDDTATPVSTGSYKGATQEGNYVYLTVTSNRTITQFSTNSLTENCNNNSYLQFAVAWGTQEFPIGSDGTFSADYSWTGSQTANGVELTAETWKITGTFATATTVTGTIALADELNYQGTHYSCSGAVTYSATLQG